MSVSEPSVTISYCNMDIFDSSVRVPYGFIASAVDNLIPAFQKQNYTIVNKTRNDLKTAIKHIVRIRNLAYLYAADALGCDIASLNWRDPNTSSIIHLFLDDYVLPNNLTHLNFCSSVEAAVNYAKSLTGGDESDIACCDTVLTPVFCISLLQQFSKLFYHPCHKKKAYAGFSDYAFFFDDDLDLKYLEFLFGEMRVV